MVRMKRTYLLHSCIVYLGIFWLVNADGSKAKRRISIDDLSQEDLDKFLESIVTRRANDAAEKKRCYTDFEEETGVILRTRDSIVYGAEFIAAPEEVDSEVECRQACCNAVSKKSSRHCDLAVYQMHDDDQPKCFLFSCFVKNGTNVCVTSPNSDYKVLRRKIEFVEKQLINVASHDASLSTNNKESEAENRHGDCSKQFTKQEGKIIRTQDSIKNGAEFLGSPKGVNTLERCKSQCCTSVSNKSSRHCDYAVFQQNDENRMRCYLFSCTDNDGKFNCVTSPNDDYMVLKRTLDIEENQLLDIITSSTAETKIYTATASTTTTTTEKPTVASTATETTTTTAPPTSDVMRTCARMEWQCDDGNCVEVTKVCNGKMDCSDNSDENGCEVLNPQTKVYSSSDTTIKNPTMSSTTEPTTTSTTKKPATASTTMESPIILTNIATDPPHQKVVQDDFVIIVGEKTEPQKGAVLPLALGLSVTACVLLMVGCRCHIMRKKLRRRGKPLSMEEDRIA